MILHAAASARRAAADALLPYRPEVDGPFGPREAGHLLRRAGFGGTLAERHEVQAWGPELAAERLTAPAPIEGEYAAVLQTLAPLGTVEDLVTCQSLWLTRMLRDPRPFRERLTLFWHGHFATSVTKVGRARLLTAQIAMLRDQGPGPLAALVASVSRDPAMIVWLDGNANRRHHPNENYARELLELFLLGEGHYSETDVLEAARAFTGWHERDGRFRFTAGEHDDGHKHVLDRSGPLDGDDVIAACLEQPAAARHVAGRLFRDFVHPQPSAALLEEVADRYRTSGYDTRALLRLLFASREFYAAQSYRSVVRSPVHLAVGAARALGLRVDARELVRRTAALGQSLLAPPSVKGWDGGLSWLNAATLIGRVNLAAELARAFGDEDLPAALAEETQGRALDEVLVDALLDGDLPSRARTLLAERHADPLALVQALLALPETQLA
ncbi:MAG: DUF1800 domain-containing protein [Planctomycetota bacterium]